MKSNLPKVLHQICGKSLIAHVIQALKDSGIDDITVVVGHGRETVEKSVGSDVKCVYQEQQLGTGHAVIQARKAISQAQTVLVVSGDTPLLTAETLRMLVEKHQSNGACVSVLTAMLPDPTGYGRIIRDHIGDVSKIVEHKDADDFEKQVKEINSGTYCFSGPFLLKALHMITPNNQQNEYYLTDVISLAVQADLKVVGCICNDYREIQGINSRLQLTEAASVMNTWILEKLMEDGVTVIDTATTYVDAGVLIGRDTVILPATILQGNTIIGEECIIGPQTRIMSSKLSSGVTVENSVVKEAIIGKESIIGPFAYLRPGTVLGSGVKIGDFVEIKKSFIGDGSKVPHLSYVGDAQIGKNVNVGAGTITCNYDGYEKFETIIGDEAFIGSNTNLVAPVQVGSGAVIGAGSTITKDVPAKSLCVARGKQVNVEKWAGPSKKKIQQPEK